MNLLLMEQSKKNSLKAANLVRNVNKKFKLAEKRHFINFDLDFYVRCFEKNKQKEKEGKGCKMINKFYKIKIFY